MYKNNYVSMTNFRRNFSKNLKLVDKTNRPLVITKYGKKKVAIVSPRTYKLWAKKIGINICSRCLDI